MFEKDNLIWGSTDSESRIIKIFRILMENLLNKTSLLIFNICLVIAFFIIYNYLNLINERLKQQKIEQTMAKLAKIKENNAHQILEVLIALAQQKGSNLWLDELTYEDKKCQVELKLKSISIGDSYNYIYSMINEKPSFKILDAQAHRRGYKSTASKSTENKEEQPKISFIVDYLNKQNAQKSQEETKEKKSKVSSKDTVYNYENIIRLSICN
jgi:hypothetical protein